MNRTDNLGLTLYEATDKFRITESTDSLNHDMEILDGAVGALPSGHTIQGQINTLKPVSIVLNPVTNANGATTVVTQDSRINEGLKAVYIEVGTPETFLAPIRITTGEGQIELYCANAVGSSTVTVVVEMATVTDSADPQPASVTSTEFDILANRIGTLSQLTTTQKTNLVGAVNEVNGKLTKQTDVIETHIYSSQTTDNVKTLFKSNGIVYINLEVRSINSVTFPTETDLFSVPSGFKPSAEVRLPAMMHHKTADVWVSYYVTITTAGYIRQSWTSTCDGIAVSSCYMV